MTGTRSWSSNFPRVCNCLMSQARMSFSCSSSDGQALANWSSHSEMARSIVLMPAASAGSNLLMSIQAAWRRVGLVLSTITAEECANYFHNAGYA